MTRIRTYGDLTKTELDYYLAHPEVLGRAERNYHEAAQQLENQLASLDKSEA